MTYLARTWTVVEVDLGTAASAGQFTITDPAIDVGALVSILHAPGPYTGKGTLADEAEMDPIVATAEPGVGSATVRWQTLPLPALSFQRGLRLTTILGLTVITGLDTPITTKMLGIVTGNVKFIYQVNY